MIRPAGVRRGLPHALALLLLSLAPPATAQRPDTLPTPRVPDAVLEAIPRGLFVDAGVVASAAAGWDEAGASGRADRAGLGAGFALGYAGARLAARAGGEVVVPGLVTRDEVRVSQFVHLDVRLLGRLVARWRPDVTAGYVHQMLAASGRGDDGDSHGFRLGLALEGPLRDLARLRLEVVGGLLYSEAGDWYAVPRVALGYRLSPPATR